MLTPSPSARLLRHLLHLALAMPRSAKVRLAGPAPRNDRGVPLDLDTHLMGWLDRRLQPPRGKGSPAQARARMKHGISIVACAPRPVPTRAVEVGGVPGRLYDPGGPVGPLLVFLHGGGWVVGDLDTHDALCRRLAHGLHWRVLAVDYRLAPEHPFPAGLDDVLAVLADLPARAAELGTTADRLVLGGDSAGGNLAAAACLVLRDGGRPLPALQVLIYPAVDMRCLAESHRLFAEGFVLTEADVQYYLGHYGVPDLADCRASPLLAEDLGGLPPAVIMTAGFDPLRDEGEAYAAALDAAGVPVVHLDAADLVHGFVNMDGALPAADRELRRLEDALRLRV